MPRDAQILEYSTGRPRQRLVIERSADGTVITDQPLQLRHTFRARLAILLVGIPLLGVIAVACFADSAVIGTAFFLLSFVPFTVLGILSLLELHHQCRSPTIVRATDARLEVERPTWWGGRVSRGWRWCRIRKLRRSLGISIVPRRILAFSTEIFLECPELELDEALELLQRLQTRGIERHASAGSS